MQLMACANLYISVSCIAAQQVCTLQSVHLCVGSETKWRRVTIWLMQGSYNIFGLAYQLCNHLDDNGCALLLQGVPLLRTLVDRRSTPNRMCMSRVS